MSHGPTVLRPVPKQHTPVRAPVRPVPQVVQVLRAARPSMQLSFQFHAGPEAPSGPATHVEGLGQG